MACCVRCSSVGVFGMTVSAADYAALRDLKASPDWQTVTVALSDLVPDQKNELPLSDWQTVTELRLTPSYQSRSGLRIPAQSKAWQGPREIRNLRWEER